MKSSPRRAARRALSTLAFPLLALLVLFGVTLRPIEALAAGTVSIDNRQPEERDGRWKLKMTIDYGGTPHLNYIPMLFVFTPTVLYERALLDATGDKPVLNKIPLRDQPPVNESMDVGFSDGTGAVFRKTKFDFVIRRDRGFEAGEYTLKIKRASDGVQMGQIQKITLLGDNPIVDRRAIVFSGEKKKKPEAPKEEPAEAPKSAEESAAPEEASEPEAPSSSDESAAAPPPVPPKQGGCGCRLGSSRPAGSGALAFLGLSAFAALRRRRRPS